MRIPGTPFAEDARGVTFVEFALIAPVAMLLVAFVGVVGQGMEMAAKTTQVARTLGNLVSMQTGGLTSAELTCMLNAGAAIMSPWDPSTLTVTLSQVHVAGSAATVAWSRSTGTAARDPGSLILRAGASLPDNTDWIVAEVRYTFTPPFVSNSLMGPVPLTSTTWSPTRGAGAISIIPKS